MSFSRQLLTCFALWDIYAIWFDLICCHFSPYNWMAFVRLNKRHFVMLLRYANAAARVVSGTKYAPASLWATLARCGRCVCMASYRITYLNYAHHSLKLPNDSIFVPPLTAICLLFPGFSWTRTAVAPSLSLDLRHGTRSVTICVNRTCVLRYSLLSSHTEDVPLRTIFITSSGLEGVSLAIMRYINRRWH